MEVEVTEMFSPQAGKRPANFVVLKYFLLGMLFSNAIESILIVPKTLSLMEENEEDLEKLARIYEEHDTFKNQLREYSQVTKKIIKQEKENFNDMVGNEGTEDTHESNQHHKKPKKKHIKFAEDEGPLGGAANEKMIEYMLLIYGILTCGLGIFAVFKEQDKLLMIFIGIVGLGLIVLFFSGLTLIVFMAILNDVIIGIVSYKYLQMMTQPVAPDYVYGMPGTGVFPEAAYTVDLNEPSAYGVQQVQQ